MKRFVLGLALFLAVVSVSAADPQCHTHAQQVAVVPVGQVLVPVYGAVYTPPQQAQQNQQTADVLLEILAELRAMRAELAALKNPQAAQQVASVLPTLRTACARCHSPAGADKDGGGFVLFDARGELSAALNDRDRARVANRVSRNSMPPAPSKLGAKEKAEIVKAFEKK